MEQMGTGRFGWPGRVWQLYQAAAMQARDFEARRLIARLIWVNVAVFALQLIGGPALTGLLALGPQDSWQLWRYVTYMFCHGGLLHISLNMWALFTFGPPVAAALGKQAFLRLYIASGVIGGALWLLFNSMSLSGLVGASAAVCGVIGAAAVLFPNQRVMLLLPPIPMRVRTLVVIMALIDFAMLFGESNVAHLAHLGGVAAGIFIVRKLRAPRQTSLWARLKRSLRPSPPAREPPQDWSGEQPDLDAVLDKVGEYGMHSLTPQERQILSAANRRMAGR